MKRRLPSLLAGIALAFPVVSLPVTAAAAQGPSDASVASTFPAETGGDSLATAEVLQSDLRFDQQELDELAALEAENVELQQQEAGFFGPRLGTIIIIAIVLVLVL